MIEIQDTLNLLRYEIEKKEKKNTKNKLKEKVESP